jgi:hypothetical protein
MARGNSRADTEYSNPFGSPKASKPKRSPGEILAAATGKTSGTNTGAELAKMLSGVVSAGKKPEPKAKAEKAPKGDVAATLSKLGTDDFLKALPKELTDTMGKRIRAGIEVPEKALVSYDPDYSDDEDGDDSDRDVSSAEYWQDNKTEFMRMVDKDMKSEPIDRDDGGPGIKDAAGNVFKISSIAYETRDKINYSPKEWGQKTIYTLEVNGKKLKSWSRYEITGG